MDLQEYELMYRAEDRHWWYRGMDAITRRTLGNWYTADARLRILDAGCGTGAALTACLAEYGAATGVDISPVALRFCRLRKAERLARASVVGLPFSAGSFDLVTSFDVLYERAVMSDSLALDEFHRVLSPGGRVFLRLPAYDWLRGQHDEVVHTARRYTSAQVADLLQRSGFTVEHLSYANMFLFPVALVKRLAERLWPPRRPQSDLTRGAGPFNGILKFILSMEAPLVARSGLPFGLSVIAVGRKAGGNG